MSLERLAWDFELTPEQERHWILNLVGPDGYAIVVSKALRDAIMEKHQLTDEDVPGLIVHTPFYIPPAKTIRAPYTTHRPLPYPPHLKGRYAR